MADGGTRPNRTALAAAVAAVVAVVALVVVLAWPDDDGDTIESTGTTSGPGTTATTETSEPTATTGTTDGGTTTAAPPTVASSTTTGTGVAPDGSEAQPFAVWPWSGGELRYDDPRQAAQGFAEELVGFTDPLIGEYQAGDSRSGEVEVRPRPEGPVTTVLVRQFGPDDSWWVLGSQTEHIVLAEPASGDTVADPVDLRGQALAYEGTVQVWIMADGRSQPVGEGFVTGSGGPDLGPFDGAVTFDDPGAGWGSLVLYTMGGEDPVVWEATVTRVRFAGAP